MKYKYEFWLEDGSVEFYETEEYEYVKDMFSRSVQKVKRGALETYINMNKVIKVNVFRK